MKKALMLCLSLFVLGAFFATTAGSSAQKDDGFQAFWQKFKTSVTGSDKTAVAGLSRFPIGMSYGIRSIRNSTDLRRRYREVFSQQTNAVKCFATKEPQRETENPKRYNVACPDEAGNEVVIYQFEQTKKGWKFVGLDNINE